MNYGFYINGERVKHCPKCGKKQPQNRHDPCFGTIPNVRAACCGHGDSSEMYIAFNNGWTMQFFKDPQSLFFFNQKEAMLFSIDGKEVKQFRRKRLKNMSELEGKQNVCFFENGDVLQEV
jgi:hypothetical protein